MVLVIRVERLSKSFGQPVLRDVSSDGSRGVPLRAHRAGRQRQERAAQDDHRAHASRQRQRHTSSGEDVLAMTELELAGYRAKFGMLFQNNALFDAMTVAENIAFPLRRMAKLDQHEIDERVHERLAAVSLPGFGDRTPSGLSGGQKKRVGVARATITRAPIIFYDEPAAGLDPVTSQKIFELLRAEQQRAKTTVIMVSSDIDRLLTVTDRVGMMYRGALIFDGTTPKRSPATIPT